MRSATPETYLQKKVNTKILPYVFLETLTFNKENKKSFLFSDFSKVIIFNSGDNLESFFKKCEAYLNKGFWLSGYFSYEFGYYLEPALYHLQKKNAKPLAWIGVCKKPEVMDKKKESTFKKNLLKEAKSWKVRNVKPNITKVEYSNQIKEIKKYLEEGLSYQVNYTFKLKFDFKGDPLGLYLSLRRSQPTCYAALINTGKENILSFSPELFFKISNGKIVSRPMKGTVQRGWTDFQDKKLKQELKKSDKIKAENLMIVDLLRNDLGRISDKVNVTSLFNVEKYRTLYQMTSTIEGKPKKGLTIGELFKAIFPCGSVTGAPKIKTMEIIRKLEKEPRGVYTGAIGYISPSREACFNVGIRTIQLNKGKGELGVGGGIIYDSSAKSEYKEAILKAKFFTDKTPRVKVIETILWEKNKGYYLLDLHMKRLKKTCKYFFIPLNLKKIKEKLKNKSNLKGKRVRFRIEVDFGGNIKIESEIIKKSSLMQKVKVSARRITQENIFLYHKTNQRVIYNTEREKAQKQGFFEVIFLNTKGEVTEGSISNIFIRKGKKMYTPSLESGLLPGTLRQDLLKKGKLKEKVLYLKDLIEADKVYMGNSIRGLFEVRIKFPSK